MTAKYLKLSIAESTEQEAMYLQWYETDWILSSPKTLYKTQIRELKDECEERNKLYKEAQQRLAEYEEER